MSGGEVDDGRVEEPFAWQPTQEVVHAVGLDRCGMPCSAAASANHPVVFPEVAALDLRAEKIGSLGGSDAENALTSLKSFSEAHPGRGRLLPGTSIGRRQHVGGGRRTLRHVSGTRLVIGDVGGLLACEA
jgi:hypothetical protein